MPFLNEARLLAYDSASSLLLKVTLQYMLSHSIGFARATPVSTILAHLNETGYLQVDEKGFHDQVVASAREKGAYIASAEESGIEKVYLVETREDVQSAVAYHEKRIQFLQERGDAANELWLMDCYDRDRSREMQHLDRLIHLRDIAWP
jgi:hypothetical protein